MADSSRQDSGPRGNRRRERDEEALDRESEERNRDNGPGKRQRRERKSRIRRPAESTALLAAAAAVLVSILGFDGPQAKEMTASLTGLLGVIPIITSKFVDWKRERDEREAEKLDLEAERNELEEERNDLIERAVLALENGSGRGRSAETNEAAALILDGEGEPDQQGASGPNGDGSTVSAAT